jgi:hypothetical protein
MPSSSKTSFVLSANDLEAAFINALLREQAELPGSAIGRIVDLKRAWGRTGVLGGVDSDEAVGFLHDAQEPGLVQSWYVSGGGGN